MGFLSSTDIYVGTSIQRVVEDDKISDTISSAIKKAVIQGTDIPRTITDELLNGPVLRMHKMHRYFKREHAFGPTLASQRSNLAIESNLQQEIEEILGTGITVNYQKIDAINFYHVAWQTLRENYNYSFSLNELRAISAPDNSGETVYLEDMRVFYNPNDWGDSNGEGVVDVLGISPKSGPTEGRDADTSRLPAFPESSTENKIQVIYSWWTSRFEEEETADSPDENGDPIYEIVEYRDRNTDSFDIAIDHDPGDIYVMVEYENSAGSINYFTYLVGTGTHIDIDKLVDGSGGSTVDLNEYWPFISFIGEVRADMAIYDSGSSGLFTGNASEDTSSLDYGFKKDMTSSTYSDLKWHKDNVKALEYLNISYQEIGQSIQENPDVDKIENAVLAMAVAVEDENQLNRKYCYKFFDKYLEFRGLDEIENTDLVFHNANYKMTLNWLNLKKFTSRSGTKASVGEYHMEIKWEEYWTDGRYWATGTYAFTNYNPSTPPEADGDWYVTDAARILIGNSGTRYVKVLPDDYYFDGPQWSEAPSDSPNFKRSVRFRRWRKYHVFYYQYSETHYDKIEVRDLRTIYDVRGKNVVASVNDDKLLIPLNFGIGRNEFSLSDREALYQRSMHFIFNSREVVERAWYETEFFARVLQVVAIVITVYSLGTAFATLAAAFSAGVIAFTVALIETIVVALAVDYGFSLLVDAIGLEAAYLVAIVAGAFGTFKAISHGSVKGAPWASELIQVSSGLGNAINDRLATDMAQLQSDAAVLQREMERASGDLERATALLEPSERAINPMFVVGESPQDFYARTIHSGNIGTVAYDYIEHYVDVNLKLPTFNETVGSTFYGY